LKRNEKVSNALAIVAGMLSVTAFIIYSWSILAGHAQSNISSWAVWTFLTMLNARSYVKLLKDDWLKGLLPVANAVMTIATLFCAIWTGSFKTLSGIDEVCLVIGVIAGLVWIIWKSAKVVQMVLQIAIVVGFIPTFIGVWQYPIHEPWFPWLLWATCFATQCLVVKANPKRTSWIEFLYPVDMLICHGAVFVLALL